MTVGQAKNTHLTLLSWIWERQNNTPDCFVVTVGKAKPQSDCFIMTVGQAKNTPDSFVVDVGQAKQHT